MPSLIKINGMDLQGQSHTFNFANTPGLPDIRFEFNDNIVGYKTTTVLASVVVYHLTVYGKMNFFAVLWFLI